LWIDGDEGDRDELISDLRDARTKVRAVSTGEAGLAYLDSGAVDLIVVDPDLDGLRGPELLHTLRKRDSGAAILVLAGEESFAVARAAVRVGAADYLLKPLERKQLGETVRRILADREQRAVKKQLYQRLESTLSHLKDLEGIELPEIPDRRVVTVSGGVRVDLDRRRLLRGQDEVNLTPQENRTLGIFLRNRDRVVTHQELVREIKGEPVAEEDAAGILRPVISRLRRKLEHFQGAGWIDNVRGKGYVFDAGPELRDAETGEH
jgi:two-component system KDP operon response regulator KdpE